MVLRLCSLTHPANIGTLSMELGGAVEAESLANEYVMLLSAAKILKDLGMNEFASELGKLTCLIAGELAIHLNTGKYVDGLASAIKDTYKSLWETEIDEYSMINILKHVLELRDKIRNGISALSPGDVAKAKEFFTRILRRKRRTLPEPLQRVLSSDDPATLIQSIATALVVTVGGVNGI